MVFVFISLILLYCSCENQPFILVPGIGGSNLEVSLHDAEPGSIFCKKNSDWYQIWINILEDVRWLDVNCFVYNLFLNWDNKTESIYPNTGVEMRTKDFGGVDGISYLDKNFKKSTVYFGDFVKHFVVNYGYEVGKNIRGAPFDFRRTPLFFSEDNQYYSDLKNLVEETYEINDQQKVHFVTHSMGSPVINVFLNSYVDEAWKEKYIDSMISISGAWDGAPEAYAYLFLAYELPNWLEWKVFGQSLQKYIAHLNPLLQQFPGIQWLVPNVFFQDTVVVMTDKKNYTGSMYKEMMEDSGHHRIYELFEYAQQTSKINKAPGVELHCIYTDNVDTGAQYYIDDLTEPVIGKTTAYVPGDGTVAASAAKICDSFEKLQTQSVDVTRTKDLGHIEIISDPSVWDLVASIVVKND